jgi:hypothetical protein
LGIKSKTTYEKIIEWLETHDGKMPKNVFWENRKRKTINQLTEEEKGEANLYGRWLRSEEYKILQNYVGKDISEVPEEYREKIAKLRSFGLGITTYEEIIEWLETHDGKMPRSAFSEKGKMKKSGQFTEEEKGEANLYGRWIRSEEYKILQNYVGKDISEVPEEYREKIAKLRSFGFGLKKGKKEKLKEVIEDRDVAKELNEETRELEHQVSEELNKRKGKLKI